MKNKVFSTILALILSIGAAVISEYMPEKEARLMLLISIGMLAVASFIVLFVKEGKYG